MGTTARRRDEPACTENAGSGVRDVGATELHVLLEETDEALAECLGRLERLSAWEAPAEVRNGLVGLKDLLKAARVDLTAYYTRQPSSN